MFSEEYGINYSFKLVAVKLVELGDVNYDGAYENMEKPYWRLTLGQFDWDGSGNGFSLTSIPHYPVHEYIYGN